MATQAELKSAYKKLAVQWHSDKAQDSQAKREYGQKFMEIQQAYDMLFIRNKTRDTHFRKNNRFNKLIANL